VLPVSFLSPAALLTGAGGFAAAIAIGAFFGQAHAILSSTSDQDRRWSTAVGGFAGLIAMIGLILVSLSVD
jgi:hypothetical protein